MFPALKTAFLPVALLAILFGGAAAIAPTPPAHAAIATGVWFLEDYTPGTADTCAEGDPRDVRVFSDTVADQVLSDIDATDGIDDQDPVVQIGSTDELIICVQPDEDFNVVFDSSNDGASWNEARCATLGTECVDEEGVGDDAVTVPRDTNDLDNLVAVTFSCNLASVQTITITQDDANGGDGDAFTFIIMCKGEATSMDLTAVPASVIESSPAIGNTAHALIRAVITDGSGNPILPGTEVDFETSRCALSTGLDTLTLAERVAAIDLFMEQPILPPADLALHTFANSFPTSGLTASTGVIEVDTNIPPDGVPNHSEALAILHAEGCAPGAVTVTARIEREDLADLEATVTITVVGSVATITITASPTTLICGEKSEIKVGAKDVANHDVSDHTFIEVITNFGGVLGGTGSSLTVSQPVNPLSSTTVEIIKSTGTAYLLTSDKHVGAYEVLAASTLSYLGGSLNTIAPATAQVTVTCTKGTPAAVTAPNTGTGTITPPNTGDAGLAGTSRDTASLFVIAGALAFVVAGLASFGYARR